MKVYIAYKLSNTDQEKLKPKLEQTSQIIENLGHESFIFLRDCENWNPKGKDPKWVMKKAMEEMKQCDVILALVETQEKGEGMLLESGYMKALGKKVIVARKPQGRAILLRAIADEEFEYKNVNEFKKKLQNVLN